MLSALCPVPAQLEFSGSLLADKKMETVVAVLLLAVVQLAWRGIYQLPRG